MPSIIAPGTHGQSEGTAGFSSVFLMMLLQSALEEELDAMDLGLSLAMGDLAGSGSDTARVTRVDGLGWGERFSAVGAETGSVAASGWELDSDTVTIGRYSLIKADSYLHQILHVPGQDVDQERLARELAASWRNTLKYLVAQAVGTFATGAGTSGTAWTYDDELELIALFHETDGFDPSIHTVRSIRAAKTFTQLRDSIRNEPGLQGSAELQQALMGLGGPKGQGGSFSFLGIDNHKSKDVVSSGGDYVGGAYVDGAIAHVHASTAPAQQTEDPDPIYLPDTGLMIERTADAETTVSKIVGNGWMGVDKLSSDYAPQFSITAVQ